MGTLYSEIASCLQAMRNCVQSNNKEWLAKHGERLKEMVDMLPSGSGIDSGVKLDEEACNAKRLVFTFGYHHMNDAGMYDCWTEHVLYVTPSFDGIDLKISGRDRNQIKEYLYELFHNVLTEELAAQ